MSFEKFEEVCFGDSNKKVIQKVLSFAEVFNKKSSPPWNTSNSFKPSFEESIECEKEIWTLFDKMGFEIPKTKFPELNAFKGSIILQFLHQSFFFNQDKLKNDRLKKDYFDFVHKRVKTFFTQLNKNIALCENNEVFHNSFVIAKENYGRKSVYCRAIGIEPAQFVHQSYWSDNVTWDIVEMFFEQKSYYAIKRFVSNMFNISIGKKKNKGEETLYIQPYRKTMQLSCKLIIKPILGSDGGPANSTSIRRVPLKSVKHTTKDDMACAFLQWLSKD
jgi:hypothetical protein